MKNIKFVIKHYLLKVIKAFQYNCVIFPQAAPFFLYLKKLKIEIFVPQNIGPSRYMYLGMTVSLH